MQGSSRGAFTAAQHALDTALRDGANGAVLGDELFSVVAAMEASAALRRGVADPSREPAAKAALAQRLFGHRVSAPAAGIVATVVQQRWAAERDLTDTVENLAVQAVLSDAEKSGRADRVEDELFRFERIVAGNPSLRDVVTDRAIPGRAKLDLVDELLAAKCAPETVRLARQAVGSPRGRRFARVIEDYLGVASLRRAQMTATVISAVPLDETQRERLTVALTSIYGRQVHLNTVIDPSVIGGIRVQIGDEVVDGTVLRKLDSARRHMGA
jgi:F-type H+-transporting ATPase subunit delta